MKRLIPLSYLFINYKGRARRQTAGGKGELTSNSKVTNCLFNYKNKCVNDRFKFYWGLCVELL